MHHDLDLRDEFDKWCYRTTYLVTLADRKFRITFRCNLTYMTQIKFTSIRQRRLKTKLDNYSNAATAGWCSLSAANALGCADETGFKLKSKCHASSSRADRSSV